MTWTLMLPLVPWIPALYWMHCTMKRQDIQMDYMRSLDRSLRILSHIIWPDAYDEDGNRIAKETPTDDQ